MHIIIELDGPVLDLEPGWYAAYHQVCGDMGLPRMDQAAYWRLVRRGAPDSEILRGAKPAQWREFRAAFDEAVTEDAIIKRYEPQENVDDSLSRLSRSATTTLVTHGQNREARKAMLDTSGLSDRFGRTLGLPADRARWKEALGSMADGDPRVVIVAASEILARTAQAGGFLVVGVANGACAARRLRSAGADPVFDDLDALADDLEKGSPMLISAGLLPQSATYKSTPF